MNLELEHGRHNLLTNVTDDDPQVTAKIALAHLNESFSACVSSTRSPRTTTCSLNVGSRGMHRA